tara:strand:- start:91 stop:414 length:324 start_codon:yes stop_codon:yes gene_type:complete
MKRGDIVTVSVGGDYGKPRPALIIQSDLFIETASVTILPLTSHLINAPLIRIEIEADETNGLKKTSQIMIDKLLTTPREKVGDAIGCLQSNVIMEVERALALFVGIA